MKTTIFNKKAHAFFGAAALLFAAVFTIGCKTEISSSDPAPETFTVEMKAGEHGTVTANPAIPTSGKVAKDTVITFTAVPATGYKVDKWTITGGTFESGTGTEGSLTAKVKISANTKVSVSFKEEAITPPSPTEFTVEMKAGEHGTVTASPAIPTSGKVAKDTVITFTAAPASGYKVDKWTITGGAFETGTGTEGSTTAKVKITADTKVNVSFISMYAIVPFGTNGAGLDNHLKTAAPHTDGIYYIEVTGLTAADLKGDNSSYTFKPSRLGKILKDNPTKKVALKLSEVSGLTDMSYCFYDCTSLTQAPEIPSGVTNMMWCFSRCKSLTQAPVIPSGVTNMQGCFFNCESLTQAPEIPSSVTDMERCFSDCTSLTQVPVIPSGVTNMSSCFSGCTSLTQAPAIPSGVTNMSSCFSGCTSLTQAPVIPSGVTYMQGCFSGCKRLTQASVIPSGVTGMHSCFSGCESLTQAPAIPSGVTNMDNCFYGCKSLTQAPAIPSGVTSMSNCFRDCKSLTQAPAIPSGVTDMSFCFENCEGLTQAPVIPSGVTDMSYCFCGCKSLTQAPVIPSGVTNMELCFCGCKSLTQAPAIPSGVTNMYSCFSGCKSLTQAPAIPSGVTNMYSCFSGCKSLTQAPAIPSGVTNMQGCFRDCEKITAVTLKCNYNEGRFDSAFYGCKALTANSIKVPAGQLQTYKDNAAVMEAQAEWFVAGE